MDEMVAGQVGKVAGLARWLVAGLAGWLVGGLVDWLFLVGGLG